ncbi:MAG: hypothetical protein Q4D96_04580 [Propionibacteriaceae bacterium]|nr:hypothetical protein [Propionibacteriaceae bacterium]
MPTGSEYVVDWAEFEKHLFDQLVTLPERVIFIIGPGENQRPYIQFAGIHAFSENDMDITCGFQDDVGFDRKFTPEEEAFFVECNFERRGDDPTYWEQEVPWPPSGQALLKMVRGCMVRLRDVAAVASPEELTYRSWRNGGYGIGQFREMTYPADPDFDLPGLYLRRIES